MPNNLPSESSDNRSSVVAVFLKPSGVPWLGDIPAEWDVARVKSLESIVSTRSTSNDHYIGLENVESGTGRFLPAPARRIVAFALPRVVVDSSPVRA